MYENIVCVVEIELSERVKQGGLGLILDVRIWIYPQKVSAKKHQNGIKISIACFQIVFLCSLKNIHFAKQ